VYPEYHKDLELLEIEEGASLSELKTAYRELTKVWHPDRFKHDPKLAEKASRKLAEIIAAYKRLEGYLNSSKQKSSSPPQSDLNEEMKQPSDTQQKKDIPRSPAKRALKSTVIFFVVLLIVLAAIKAYQELQSDYSIVNKQQILTAIDSYKDIDLLYCGLSDLNQERRDFYLNKTDEFGASRYIISEKKYLKIGDIRCQEGYFSFNHLNKLFSIELLFAPDTNMREIKNALISKFGRPNTYEYRSPEIFEESEFDLTLALEGYSWSDKINSTAIYLEKNLRGWELKYVNKKIESSQRSHQEKLIKSDL
jgi:curved DNA-binding protein CbpA